ncbi:ferritin-like domain-containing protein [Croceivirga sp. JEA036]|uniref:ferritin-like domain-containing protein n=1 Tax=Croceivirga sp. JEA036 TaxID=2721162 RepID=UPI00143BF257|nr:PA2169 family four-helix-bundle protein [Croceivirga sp. JEA036]NJB36335.1 PA2169 family four-helix-bundle protein [Croceivirga sp. JEA036]
MEYSVEMSNKLNELLTRTYDAEKGFKEAAEHVDNPIFEKFFMTRAKQRYEFGHELKSEIKTFGQNPDKGGSAMGTLHRNWMNLKSYFNSNNDEAMLSEVERGEKEAVNTYDDILNDKDFVLPPSTESILMRQRNAIKKTLDTAKIYERAVS